MPLRIPPQVRIVTTCGPEPPEEQRDGAGRLVVPPGSLGWPVFADYVLFVEGKAVGVLEALPPHPLRVPHSS